MKKYASVVMMTAMMMSAAYENRHYMTVEDVQRARKQRMDNLKELAHKELQRELTQHEFVIHGERIMAHNRKSALKIYAKRHPELKRKKK